jgi:hypothetical protein
MVGLGALGAISVRALLRENRKRERELSGAQPVSPPSDTSSSSKFED